MGKMKRTAPRARPTSNGKEPSEDTRGHLQTQSHADPSATAANPNTVNLESVMQVQAKSSMATEKTKNRIVRQNSTAFRSPTKVGKGKESMVRERRSTTCNFGSLASGASGAAKNRTDIQGMTDFHADSEDNVDTSTGIVRETMQTDVEESEITKAQCRKQLATLRTEDKRPPPSITAASFASKFRLPSEGINSHKLKIGRDITLEEVQDVFGEEKAKNGFALGGKLTPSLRKEAEKLYCLCYQKPFAPAHVAKEFAIGFVLDKVKRQKVNWAEFAAETNEGQRKSYSRRLRGCIKRLAGVLNVPVDDVFEAEGFKEYAIDSRKKLSIENEECHIVDEARSTEDAPVRTEDHKHGIADLAFLFAKKAAVGVLVQKFEALLQSNDLQVQEKKTQANQAAVQWEACSQLVEQFKSSLIEAGQDCSTIPGEEEMEAAIQQIGIGPIFKMYYSNVKKLSAFAARKCTLEYELHLASSAMTANSNRLTALKEYLDELGAGKDAVTMRPLPSCSNDEDSIVVNAKPLLPSHLLCSICGDGFPLFDVILCPCQHVYHPWCAAQWFRNHINCADPICGPVSALWYSSWGFGEYDQLLAASTHDDHKTSPEVHTGTELPLPTSKMTLGSSTVSEGAPSLSGCDSNISKCLGQQRQHFIPRVLKLGFDGSDFSQKAALMDMDGPSTPFGSQHSTPSTNFRNSCTVTSVLETSPLQVQISMTAGVPQVCRDSNTPRSSAPDIEGFDALLKSDEGYAKNDSDLFAIDKNDPLLQEGSAAPEILPSNNVEDDAEVVVPPQPMERQISTETCSVSVQQKSAAEAQKVGNNDDDPYSLAFSRSSKRLKKASDSSPILPSRPDDDDTSGHISDGALPSALPSTLASATIQCAREGAEENVGMENVSAPDVGGRVLRHRPPPVRTPAERPPPNQCLISGPKKSKGDSTDVGPALDKSYTYVRSLGIHASVNEGALLPRRSGSDSHANAHDESAHAVPYDCPYRLQIEERDYVGGGLLHPRYIVHFHKRRSGWSPRLVYCKALPTCTVMKDGHCNGHVPLQYIKECNRNCPCALDYPNRVVQRGVTTKLEVFYVNNYKGWGIRTMQTLRRGTFVFEYAGEVVTNAELLTRGDRSKYSIALDADWESEVEKDDNSLLCIDATEITNVARWLNHRCSDANFMDMPVWVESRSPTLYHVAFFTNRLVLAGEELTWDYGIDFGELPSPFQCCCDSSHCRGK